METADLLLEKKKKKANNSKPKRLGFRTQREEAGEGRVKAVKFLKFTRFLGGVLPSLSHEKQGHGRPPGSTRQEAAPPGSNSPLFLIQRDDSSEMECIRQVVSGRGRHNLSEIWPLTDENGGGTSGVRQWGGGPRAPRTLFPG